MEPDRPPFEVADVIRRAGGVDGDVPGLRLSRAQRRVVWSLAACRTSRLGGHVEECDQCAHRRVAYNSCRNRHCPKCQAARRAQWLEARQRDLLPVEYFHVVFTVPEEVARVALQNKRLVYEMLFRCAWETLQAVAANPKHLGAKLGMLAVLHTWGQTLLHHPHVHCVVPGGGLSDDGRWVACRRGFFLPVRVLSRLFRGKFVAALQRAFGAGKLSLCGRLADLADGRAFARWCRAMRQKEWVVYAKPPFGGPEQVLKYLARYTHRVAIANRRIVAVDAEHVTFEHKDYARGGTQRTMRLRHTEFLRRFLLHVLPKGLVRIRYYGLLSNRNRERELELCRRQLGEHATMPATEPKCDVVLPLVGRDIAGQCPVCERGSMVRVETIEPGRDTPRVDTS